MTPESRRRMRIAHTALLVVLLVPFVWLLLGLAPFQQPDPLCKEYGGCDAMFGMGIIYQVLFACLLVVIGHFGLSRGQPGTPRRLLLAATDLAWVGLAGWGLVAMSDPWDVAWKVYAVAVVIAGLAAALSAALGSRTLPQSL